MTFVWQIREKNGGLWLQDSGQGWNWLVEQHNAYLWRREDLAEKAVKKVLKKLKRVHDYPQYYKWFKGFSQNVEGKPISIRKYVDFEIVCSKLVFAECKDV